MRTLWRFIAGFFKWTWRLLNFVREMVLNLFFIFLVLVGVGIWMQVSGGDSKETVSRGALLLDISGVIVDKPDSSQRFSKLSRQLLGASSDRLQENSLFDIVNHSPGEGRPQYHRYRDGSEKLRRRRPAVYAVHRQSPERVS